MSTTTSSSPSASTPSTEPTLEQRIHMTTSFQSFLHNASITMLIAAPLLVAIPPRKLDLYTFSLGGAFVASANHLTKERTGAGLLYQLPGARMPAYALEFQERERARKEGRRLLEVGEEQEDYPSTAINSASATRATLDTRLEKDDWKTRRLAEEQKKLDEGEGYGGMIVDQIWEVWNWGEKKAEEIKEIDEQVVARQKQVDKSQTSKPRFVMDKNRQKRWREEFPEIGKG